MNNPGKTHRPIPPVPMSRQGDVQLSNMLPNAGGNIFRLARISMVRALEIHEGSKPLIEHDPADKATSIALHEIAQGKLVYKQNLKQ